MAAYLVAYDLIKDKDYTKIINRMKALGGHKALLSTWLIDSQDTAEGLFNDLRSYLDKDDRLIVSRINTKATKTFAYPGTRDWLASHN
jgi:hypothetical protein